MTPDLDSRLALYTNYPMEEVFGRHGIETVIEFGSWMFEMVAAQPYSTLNDLLEVVREMKHQYNRLNMTGHTYLTIPHIPLLGTSNDEGKSFKATKSQYVHDGLIANHPRYFAMMENMI